MFRTLSIAAALCVGPVVAVAPARAQQEQTESEDATAPEAAQDLEESAADREFWLWPRNASRTSVKIEGGVVYSFAQKLYRNVNRRERHLDCTFPDGYGWIVDLDAHPEGLVFVAAANGIYVTSPQVDVGDTLNLSDGAPTGRPVGIHVDDRGKLWICTDKELGILDTDVFYGRVFTLDDGYDDLILLEGASTRPVGQFTGMAATDDGGLLISTQSQLFAYKPGRLPKPEVEILSVNGEPYQPGKVYHVDDFVPLEARATGAGEPMLRYRRHGWHEWEPIKNDEIRWLFPGAYTIDVIAVDRELNTSEPKRIEVWVNFPFYKQAWFLGGLLVIGEIVIFLLLWRGRRLATPTAAAVVMVVLLLIGVQLAAALRESGSARRFRGFGMDIDYMIEQGVLHKIQLVGFRRDGIGYEEIRPEAAGRGVDGYQRIIEVVHGSPEEQRQLLEDYNERHPHDPLKSYKVQLRRWRMRGGALEVARLDLLTVNADT